ncbi:hypothetical protein CTEN210_06847 [Chaetoceros tenuissimus]|uniref:Uncharacterized protein n=1 Tax=Chaetoceros tenuissimus TaxID=426638 RepID=A0AAD3H4V6_9STRA|nr:hypothetical protein CTEN210_06847 [Chaetoceros tenuissimus]
MNLLFTILLLCSFRSSFSATVKTYGWKLNHIITPYALDYSNSEPLQGTIHSSGFQLALSHDGTTLAIASKLQQGDTTSGGIVQIFTSIAIHDAVEWVLSHTINVSTFGDWYGSKLLALNNDGTILAIGSRLHSNNKGSVQILELINNSWKLKGEPLYGEQEGSVGEHFGASVDISLDGNTLIVGSPFYNFDLIPGVLDSSEQVGKVTIFQYDTILEEWEVDTVLYGESESDEFGTSVALAGDARLAVVGAQKNNVDQTKFNGGHVRVYAYDQVLGWSRLGSDINGEQALDFFGSNVVMAKEIPGSNIYNRIAASAGGNDGTTEDPSFFENIGHTRAFDYNTDANEWLLTGQDIEGERKNDQSGDSLAMDKYGTRIAIGAIENDDAHSQAGHVRVYELSSDGSTWNKIGKDIDGEQSRSYLGSSVAMDASGEMLVVSAPGMDIATGLDASDRQDDAGIIYIYKLNIEEVEVEEETTNGASNCNSGIRMMSIVLTVAAMLLSVV